MAVALLSHQLGCCASILFLLNLPGLHLTAPNVQACIQQGGMQGPLARLQRGTLSTCAPRTAASGRLMRWM